MKPRNFTAKNSQSCGAGVHEDKKRAVKNGKTKHKENYMKNAQLTKTDKIPRA